MGISIFAKNCYWGGDARIVYGEITVPDVTKEPHLCRVSSRIRGEEISEYLGAKYNPEGGYKNDLCIYIKPRALDRIKDGSYVDILDGDFLIDRLRDRLKIKVIAMSQTHYEFLRKELKNEIVLIHHHHFNFDRIKRNREEITTGGYIGPPSLIAHSLYNKIEEKLKSIGLKFITCFNYRTRQDIIDHYKKIDFQIIGFPGYFDDDPNPYRHPTKVINAASFGVPTISNWKAGYKEFEDFYVPVKNMDSMITEVEKMRDKNYYDRWVKRAAEEAEKYHISKIAEKYKQLT